MKAFLVNFLVVGEFLLADSFHIFSGQKPGGEGGEGCKKSWFPEDLCTGKLDGEAFVLRCVYLFVY